MTKAPILIEDSRLVTVGILKKVLKEERDLTLQELLRLEGKIDKNEGTTLEELAKVDKSMMAIAQAFNQVQEAIADLQRVVTFLVQEIAAMREENKEFRQRTAQLERVDLIHERKIDELDGRVLKLEATG